MKINIETENGIERERVTRLLQFALSGQQAEIESLSLNLESEYDALGTKLNRCRLRTKLKRGKLIELEEVQASLQLATTRILQRCRRIIQRENEFSCEGFNFAVQRDS